MVIMPHTMEAELVSVTAEVRWIRKSLTQLGLEKLVFGPILVRCDSQVVIMHAKNCADKPKAKHTAIKAHFIREKVGDGRVELKFIQSELRNC
jgi:hypothetical protein